MKRIFTYILLMACAVLMAGCQKEVSSLLTAEIESYQGGDGKVFLDGNNFACWHDGDQLWVNGINPYPTIDFRADADGSNRRAVIAGVSTESASEFKAIYPYTYAKGHSFDGTTHTFNLEIPCVQTYRVDVNGNQVIDAPMVAYTAIEEGVEASLKFRNAFALMKIQVPHSISGTDATAINVWRIDLKATWVDIATTGDAVIKYTPSTEEWSFDITSNKGYLNELVIPEVNGTIASGGSKDFYIATIPQNSKYRVTVHYEQGGVYKKWKSPTSQANTILRNTVVTMNLGRTTGGTIEEDTEHPNTSTLVGGGTADDPYLISSAEDMETLKSWVSVGGNITSYYEQTADITLPDTWTGIGEFDHSTHLFKGKYNGNEYTITNNTGHSVFKSVGPGAVIKNVNVNVNMSGNITIADERFGGLVADVSTSSESGLVEINNCHVSGMITSISNSIKYVGGIWGYGGGMCSINIINCSNSATIEAPHATEAQGDFGVGGIIGFYYGHNEKLIIQGCRNTGDVKGQIAGGILGKSTRPCVIENCINKGTITQSGSVGYQHYVGGICGYITDGALNGHVYGSIVRNCVNRGEVTHSSQYSSRIGGLVGLVFYSDIENCYSNGIVNGKNDRVGGVLGKLYAARISNVYVGENVDMMWGPDFIKGWWVGYEVQDITMNGIYRPNIGERNWEFYSRGNPINGSVTLYNSTTMNVVDENGRDTQTSLLDQLNMNRTGHESEWLQWVDVNGKPGFAFEL